MNERVTFSKKSILVPALQSPHFMEPMNSEFWKNISIIRQSDYTNFSLCIAKKCLDKYSTPTVASLYKGMTGSRWIFVVFSVEVR